jgi:hypothetical protein
VLYCFINGVEPSSSGATVALQVPMLQEDEIVRFHGIAL